jgi:hypothetical protein
MRASQTQGVSQEINLENLSYYAHSVIIQKTSNLECVSPAEIQSSPSCLMNLICFRLAFRKELFCNNLYATGVMIYTHNCILVEGLKQCYRINIECEKNETVKAKSSSLLNWPKQTSIRVVDILIRYMNPHQFAL